MAAACLVLSIDEAISASATKSVPHAESGDLYCTVVDRCDHSLRISINVLTARKSIVVYYKGTSRLGGEQLTSKFSIFSDKLCTHTRVGFNPRVVGQELSTRPVTRDQTMATIDRGLLVLIACSWFLILTCSPTLTGASRLSAAYRRALLEARSNKVDDQSLSLTLQTLPTR
jgi:hypothetical protein